MNAAEQGQLHEILHGRRDVIVDAWYNAIARTGFVPFSERNVRQRLATLTKQAITLLLDEPFERSKAQVIGSTLAGLHYLDPEALGRTLEVLARYVSEDLPADQAIVLQPRLAALLSAVAAGFMSHARTAILTEQEQIRRALVATLDRVEAELRASEQQLRTVVTNVPIVLFALDHTGVVTIAAGKGLDKLGLTWEETIGRSLLELPQTTPQMVDNFRRALTGEAFTDIVHLDDLAFETRYAPLRDRQGEVVGVIGVAIDITERMQMEADLKAAHQQLAESHEVERLRLAQELHDSALQQLLAITYQLGMRGRNSNDTEQRPNGILGGEAHVSLDTIRQEILGVVVQLRGLIGELRPPLLEEFGLTAAIEGYVERLQHERGRDSPEIELDLDECGMHLPQPIAFCLYRTAQEALRNALKHAHAQHITLNLCLLRSEVVLSVRDDGDGFRVPARLSELTRADHFGLVGIAERVGWVGGQFTIRSRPGGGTEVTVRVPRHAKE